MHFFTVNNNNLAGGVKITWIAKNSRWCGGQKATIAIWGFSSCLATAIQQFIHFSLNILVMVFNCFAFYTTFCYFYKVSSLTCFNGVTVEMTLNGNYFPKDEILSGRRRALISSLKYHVFAQFISSRKKISDNLEDAVEWLRLTSWDSSPKKRFEIIESTVTKWSWRLKSFHSSSLSWSSLWICFFTLKKFQSYFCAQYCIIVPT